MAADVADVVAVTDRAGTVQLHPAGRLAIETTLETTSIATIRAAPTGSSSRRCTAATIPGSAHGCSGRRRWERRSPASATGSGCSPAPDCSKAAGRPGTGTPGRASGGRFPASTGWTTGGTFVDGPIMTTTGVTASLPASVALAGRLRRPRGGPPGGRVPGRLRRRSRSRRRRLPARRAARLDRGHQRAALLETRRGRGARPGRCRRGRPGPHGRSARRGPTGPRSSRSRTTRNPVRTRHGLTVLPEASARDARVGPPRGTGCGAGRRPPCDRTLGTIDRTYGASHRRLRAPPARVSGARAQAAPSGVRGQGSGPCTLVVSFVAKLA